MRKFLVKLALYVIKSQKYTDEETRKLILGEAVAHLFNTVTADDVLKENPDGSFKFEDKTLPNIYRKDLKEQAKLIPNLLLWKVIQKDIQYQINKKMYQECKITTDMLWGQMILYYNELINERIKRMSK
jgi:hypothetical protein